MKKSLVVMLLGLGVGLVGCLSGRGNYSYSSGSNYSYSQSYRFENSEPSWGEICHLRWPGEFFDSAREHCSEDFVSKGEQLDRKLYTTYIEVRDTTQLSAALDHPATYKYVHVQGDIIVDRTYPLKGNIALHGPGKLSFRSGGSFKMAGGPSGTRYNCSVHQLEQSVRILVATENPEIVGNLISDSAFHIVFQAPTTGKIRIPPRSFLALGFYSYEVESTDLDYLVSYGAKVKAWWRDFGAPTVLGTNSRVQNQHHLGQTVYTCLDTPSERASHFSYPSNNCSIWAETAVRWKSCGGVAK